MRLSLIVGGMVMVVILGVGSAARDGEGTGVATPTTTPSATLKTMLPTFTPTATPTPKTMLPTFTPTPVGVWYLPVVVGGGESRE
ncbi:MAG: hypothetical protein SWK90_14210 [Chloroflexota bacterium]|nr:hypothetical protein [Chloroflexota bacterium]